MAKDLPVARGKQGRPGQADPPIRERSSVAGWLPMLTDAGADRRERRHHRCDRQASVEVLLANGGCVTDAR